MVYADHSLEHVTNLREPLEKFSEILKPAGYHFCTQLRQLIEQLSLRWKAYIGEAHNWFHGPVACEISTSRLGESSARQPARSLFDGEG